MEDNTWNMEDIMSSAGLQLTSEEADFIYQALICHTYENYQRQQLDPNEEVVNFLKMSISLQDKMQALFPDEKLPIIDRRPRQKPRMSCGRIR